MGKQLGFEFPEPANATREGYAVAAPIQKCPNAFDGYPKGKALEPNDEVALIHRLGMVKRVRFAQVIGPRVHVIWPIANESLEISTKSGRVVAPRSLHDWKLEPNALEMARVAREMFRLERKIAVE